MTNQTKIVLASITLIVAAGLLALNPSMMVGNAQAQMYDNQYRHDNYYYQDDNRYSYDKKDPKSSHTDIQKIKCVNSNINVNGVDITQIPQDGTGLAAANEQAGPEGANTQNGNGLADRINFERNLVNICVNVNDNEQIKVTPPEEEEDQGCEECFASLTDVQEERLLEIVEAQLGIVRDIDLEDLCTILDLIENSRQETGALGGILDEIGASNPAAILNCLADLGLILLP
jgi:hypothetical protein